MVPTILICCASSIATSTVVAYKVREALEENGLEANVIQSSFAEMNAKVEMTNPDLIMVTGTVTVPVGIPRIVATAIAYRHRSRKSNRGDGRGYKKGREIAEEERR